jgi:NADH:ubiquinone oxidoreductase subunit 4 (subunit M)
MTTVSFLLPIYFLWTYHKIAYGQFSNYLPINFNDITIKEFHLFIPLLFYIIYLGINPSLIMNTINLSLYAIIS